MVAIASLVNTLCHKVIIEFVHHVVFTLKVYHRTSFTFLIYKEQTWDVGILSHLGIVGTKGWSDMYDTSTILSSNVVAWDYAESLALHLNKLILAILASKHLLRMHSCILLHVVGSILIELS